MRLVIWIAAAALGVLLAVAIVPTYLSPYGNRLDKRDDPCALLDDDAVRELRLPEPNSEDVEDYRPTCRYEDPRNLRSTSVILYGDVSMSTVLPSDPFGLGIVDVQTENYPVQVRLFPGHFYQTVTPGPVGDAGCAVYFQTVGSVVILVLSTRELAGPAAAVELCADTRRIAEAVADVVLPRRR